MRRIVGTSQGSSEEGGGQKSSGDLTAFSGPAYYFHTISTKMPIPGLLVSLPLLPMFQMPGGECLFSPAWHRYGSLDPLNTAGAGGGQGHQAPWAPARWGVRRWGTCRGLQLPSWCVHVSYPHPRLGFCKQRHDHAETGGVGVRKATTGLGSVPGLSPGVPRKSPGDRAGDVNRVLSETLEETGPPSGQRQSIVTESLRLRGQMCFRTQNFFKSSLE